MQRKAPTAPRIPAIAPTCGYVMAKISGGIRIAAFIIRLILSDEASCDPVSKSKI